jgi:amino acid transporter
MASVFEPATVAPAAEAAPRPSLSTLDAVSIIVGIVIGAGIFETPALVAANAPSAAVMLLAWVAGGIMTLTGALVFAELTTAYPHPGGNYYHLLRAFGSGPAFLFAWARLAVIQSGSIALLGFIVGDYASQVLRLGEHSSAIYAVAAAAVLTTLNMLGVTQGKWTQNLLTTATLVGLAVVVLAGFTVATPVPAAAPAANGPPGSPAAAFGLVMIFVLLTYGGWSEAAFISAEVRDVRRNMARALLGSIGIITAVYLIVNVALLRGLGLEGMAASNAVAAELMRRFAGTAGVVFVSLAVAVAALGSMNATIFTGARTNYALGRDHSLFALLGHWRARGSTPRNALLVQLAIALGLIFLGALTRKGFQTMVEYTAPVFWFFLLLTGVALFVLRRREPERPRPFRVPAYPVVPLLFCGVAGYLLYASLAYTGIGALVGAAVLITGLPLLAFMRRRAGTLPGPERKTT